MINKKYHKLIRAKDRKLGENFIYNQIAKNIIDSLDILKVPFDSILQLGINDNLVNNYLKEKFPVCSITCADIDLSVFSKKIQEKLNFIIIETSNNTGVTINLALNYGGRSDIIFAINKILKSKLNLDNFNENDFKKFTLNDNIPYPDLLIRTGGEMRLSNFLLWDLAYTELIFIDKMWPEFDKNVLDNCILTYSKRVRNYGV